MKLAFPIFRPYVNYFVFFAQIRKKHAILVIHTKNKVIYDAESINMYMWILAEEACRFTNFQILRYNDVITILY